MVAVWIGAISLLVIAICATAYVALRISDEIRFRKAINVVEQSEGGAIVIPKKVNGRSGRRNSDYRRRKAQEWIDRQINERGGRT